MAKKRYPLPGAHVAGAVAVVVAASLHFAGVAGAATNGNPTAGAANVRRPLAHGEDHPDMFVSGRSHHHPRRRRPPRRRPRRRPPRRPRQRRRRRPSTTSSTTTTTPTTTTTTRPPAPATIEKPTYYLVESNGGIHPFGGAAFRGFEGEAPTVGLRRRGGDFDGAGYWLTDTKGSVYGFGGTRGSSVRPCTSATTRRSSPSPLRRPASATGSLRRTARSTTTARRRSADRWCTKSSLRQSCRSRQHPMTAATASSRQTVRSSALATRVRSARSRRAR